MKQQTSSFSGPGEQSKQRYRPDTYNDALSEGKYELRLLINTKSAGAIIGRGGEYIKAIRAKFDAILNLPDKGTPERVLTILCRQEDLIECFKEFLFKLFDEQTIEDIDIRMLIHQSHAGAVIGRGGQKIKELREQTGTKMKVFPEVCPHSTDRILLITSNRDKIPDAIKAVVDFLRETPIKGIQKPYDAINYDPRITFSYGGYETDKRFTGGGFGQDYRGKQRGLRDRGASMNHPGSHFNYNNYGAGGRNVGYNNGMPPMSLAGGYVTIPNELGGTIIGKGGERINRIRQESGARIEVGKPYGNDERLINITGTPHQIQFAQVLLQQSVRSSEAGRRYLNEKH